MKVICGPCHGDHQKYLGQPWMNLDGQFRPRFLDVFLVLTGYTYSPARNKCRVSEIGHDISMGPNTCKEGT